MTQNNEVIKLTSEDWRELLQPEEYVIGKTTIPLKPLGMESLVRVVQLIAQASDSIISVLPGKFEKGKLAETLKDVLPTIVEVIQIEVPEVLHLMTNVDKEDIQELPSSVVVDLTIKCLDINIGSMESLSKNFTALIQKTQQLSQGIKNITGIQETLEKTT